MTRGHPEGSMATPEAAAEAQLYRVFLAQARDLAAIIAADGIVRYTSPSYQRILGSSPANLHGRSAFEHIHPVDLPREQAAFTASPQLEGTSVPATCRYRQAHGGLGTPNATSAVQ